MTSRSFQTSRSWIWRRSSRRWAVMPCAPAASQTSAAAHRVGLAAPAPAVARLAQRGHVVNVTPSFNMHCHYGLAVRRFATQTFDSCRDPQPSVSMRRAENTVVRHVLAACAGLDVVIFSASGDQMSFQHSSRIIGPLVRWLFPHLSDDDGPCHCHLSSASVRTGRICGAGAVALARAAQTAEPDAPPLAMVGSRTRPWPWWRSMPRR